MEKEKEKYTCGDCGRKTGQNHAEGCDIERCPKCNGQLLSCDCSFPYMSSDELYLLDEKGVKWKRFLVQSSIKEDFGENN